MENRIELLKPKIDVVFHSLFKKGNERITKAIISSITKEEIKEIQLEDRHIIGKYPEEKLGILDLKAILDDGAICDIEIQLADNKDTAERFLYYWSRIFSSQLEKGKPYKELNKVIGIIILDYEFDKTKNIEEISTRWKIVEETTGIELDLTDKFELFIIEIPKARRMMESNQKDKLTQWMLFLDNPNNKEVLEIMNKNEEIKEAMEELEEISKDKELRLIAELKEKAIRDERNMMEHAIEDGLKQGIEQGIEQGIQQGIEQGTKQAEIKMAQYLKSKNIDMEIIMEATNLTKEEIEKL
ncbi:MAG: Rpn family recombination-promoting nuclease/putative transposase [Clostridia bacterium]|nr:Rpn family recombination-promoting nuclease/putative transposase [Clostridia bacterium]